MSRADSEPVPNLAPTERSIVLLLRAEVRKEGSPAGDAELAGKLSLTEGALRVHLGSAYDKLGLPRLTEAERRIVIVLCRPLLQGSATPATNARIAKAVFSSQDTVKAHLGVLYERFGFAEFPQNEKRALLAGRILESGLLKAPEAPATDEDPAPDPQPPPRRRLGLRDPWRAILAAGLVSLVLAAAATALLGVWPWGSRQDDSPAASGPGKPPAVQGARKRGPCADGSDKSPQDPDCDRVAVAPERYSPAPAGPGKAPVVEHRADKSSPAPAVRRKAPSVKRRSLKKPPVPKDPPGRAVPRNPPSVQAAPRTHSACSDGRDNDGDGKTDFGQDLGCSSTADNAEKAACSDGRDNDGDGKLDYPRDPGCSSWDDGAEKEPACSDGRDNDGDGKLDYPRDPGCSSAADGAEKR